MLPPHRPEDLHRWPPPPVVRGRVGPQPLQQGIPVHPALQGEGSAFARLLRKASDLGAGPVALIPRDWHVLVDPRGVDLAELVEGVPEGFLDTFQGVETTDRRQDMGGVGPWGPAWLDPSVGFTGGQEGVQEPLSGLMGQQTCAKIVEEGEVEAGVVQVQAQRLLPIHTAPDHIGGLPIREACDIVHDHHQGQAPGGDLHGAALWGVEIGKELIVIERAKLGAEIDREVAFGKGRSDGRSRRGGNGGQGFGA